MVLEQKVDGKESHQGQPHIDGPCGNVEFLKFFIFKSVGTKAEAQAIQMAFTPSIPNAANAPPKIAKLIRFAP
jgi:hypothetical protein